MNHADPHATPTEHTRDSAILVPIRWRTRFLQLFALAGLAIAQPLLGVLSEADFWVARHATRSDVGLLLGVVVVGLPVTLLLIGWVVSLVHRLPSLATHLALVVLFSWLFALRVVDDLTGGTLSGVVVAGTSLLAAIGVGIAFIKFKGARDFISIMAIGPVVFVALFVISLPPLGGTNADAVNVGITKRNPVVFLVLDEFRVAALLDDSGGIDRTRYPNFAELADMSTWYPAASTVHDSTLKAVPAILSGGYANPDLDAVAADYPRNLFTMLADTHEMNVIENVTQLCPGTICEEQRRTSGVDAMRLLFSDASVVYLHTVVPTSSRYRLPPIGSKWSGFLSGRAESIPSDASPSDGGDDPLGPIASDLASSTAADSRAVDFGMFLDAMDGAPSASLHYLHVALPHLPFSFLESGQRYPRSDWLPGWQGDTGVWGDDPWYPQQGYQRFLLHLGYVDRLIGLMLRQLDDLDIMDEALVVVTSDHGVNFSAGEKRRAITDDTLAALAGVPMFVKYPGQTTGVIDNANAQTIDLLPTVVDALGGRDDNMDGHSLIGRGLDEPSTKKLIALGGKEYVLTMDEYLALAEAEASAALSDFPAGEGFEVVYTAAGPRPDLIGRSIDEFPTVDADGRVSIPDEYSDVDPTGAVVPAAVVAGVQIDDHRFPSFYAVAVNGVIRATISEYKITDGKAAIYAIVPPWSFRSGSNQIQVLGISGTPDSTTLIRFS